MVTRMTMSRVKITTGWARHSWADIVLGGGNSPPIHAPNSQDCGGNWDCALRLGAAACTSRVVAARYAVRRTGRRIRDPRAGRLTGTIGRARISYQGSVVNDLFGCPLD